MNESSLEYKQRVLDTKSDSFCGAKWYNATIWLGSGMTTSCHHPLPHKVSVEEVRANPAALHNTPKKKQERIMMQRGEKPSGCEYCWKIEGISKEAISDRVYKSKIYSEGDLNDAFNDTTKKDVNLQTLEIAFDRTCQFACSYCNPAFSSTWVRDIKQNGPYQGLVSDGRNHFTHAHDGSQLFDHTVTNPYVEAFFKWWESDLQYSLKELRVTGGEPLMSGEVWKLLDWFVDSGSNIQFALNTNLGAKDDLITKFIGKAKQINNMHVYTSCEATGYMANYIRDGLDFKQWSVNMHRLAMEANLKGLHVMSTINALCLWSLVDFLNWCLAFKVEYGRDFPTFTLNILRFPSFQSPLVLPLELRLERAQELEDWYEMHKGSSLLHQMELDHVRRLIDYLREVDSPHVGASSREQLAKDFKVFYAQYDQRRNKNRIWDWPKQLRDWVDSI